MKKLVTAFTAAFAAMALVSLVRNMKNLKMRSRIAEEGFETAGDILFPGRQKGFSKHKITPIIQAG